MPELAEPQNFVGADRVYHFELLDRPVSETNDLDYLLYRVTAPNLCIVRFLNAAVVGSGNVGTFTASLSGLYPFKTDQKFGYGGELISVSPANIPAANIARITWSTDVNAAYDNTDVNSGTVAQVPIPITYLPPGSEVHVLFTPSGGGNAQPYIDWAELVVELVAPSALGIGTTATGGNVYLLPQTI